MKLTAGEVRLTSSDAEINAMLQRPAPDAVGFSRHFSQGEDFFIRLGRSFVVPSFSIHHDINENRPDRGYLQTLRTLIDTLQQLAPEVFDGLTYTFDPAEVLRPTFFQLYRVGEDNYLYLLRVDLVCRPQKHQILEKGTNDTTPVHRTSELVLDLDVIPLRELITSDGKTVGGVIDQMISDTWIGETGRGYFVQGIWLDTDLTKFFSKLILPTGKRIYPYYPFSSKYRTICHHPIGLNGDERRRAVPLLHRYKQFLRPHLEQIELVLREEVFSESIPLYSEIRAGVPPNGRQSLHPFRWRYTSTTKSRKEFELMSEEQ
jgi:hypothetical protein